MPTRNDRQMVNAAARTEEDLMQAITTTFTDMGRPIRFSPQRPVIEEEVVPKYYKDTQEMKLLNLVTYPEWKEFYKPTLNEFVKVRNPEEEGPLFIPGAPVEGHMYATCDLDRISAFITEHRFWTVVEGDVRGVLKELPSGRVTQIFENTFEIVPGCKAAWAVGYIVTENPWNDPRTKVIEVPYLEALPVEELVEAKSMPIGVVPPKE